MVRNQKQLVQAVIDWTDACDEVVTLKAQVDKIVKRYEQAINRRSIAESHLAHAAAGTRDELEKESLAATLINQLAERIGGPSAEPEQQTNKPRATCTCCQGTGRAFGGHPCGECHGAGELTGI